MFSFNHFNFNVFDLERSLKFYDEALGLKPVRPTISGSRSFTSRSWPTIWKRLMKSTLSSAAYALKTRKWAYTLSRIPTAIG